jgi:hypothetical protein
MAWIAVAIGGAGVLGAGASIFGSEKQSQAAQQAAQIQQQMFNTSQANLQPFVQSGASVLPTLSKLLTPGADMSSVLSQIPGFQFAQQYGQKAITNQATSRGLSGNALTAGADYATGSANSAFGGIVSSLLGLSGQGANAAAGVAGAAGTAGGQIGSSLIGSGTAAAAGATGAANSIAGAANGYANYNLLQSLINKGGMYGGLSSGNAFNNSNMNSNFYGPLN